MYRTRRAAPRLATLIGSMVWVMTLANCGSLIMNPASTAADDTSSSQPSTVDQPDDTTPPQPADAGDDADALTFHVSRELCCDRLTYRFDADISATSIPDDARFTWRFGDARTKTGASVEHSYAWALDYVVTLTVQTPDNEVYEISRILLLSLGEEPQTVAVPDTTDGTNSPPTVSDQSVSVTARDETVLTLTGTDVDADDLTFWIVTGPAHGTLGVIDNAPLSAATIVYTPDSGFTDRDSFTFKTSDGLAESGVAVYTVLLCDPPQIMPWVECNAPDAVLNEEDPVPRTYLDYVVEGLLTWERVTDKAIVSTVIGQADIYRDLRERVPGVTVLPGIKTSSAFSTHRFDDIARWRILAPEVAAICAAAGQNRILIENELALERYYAGVEEIDFDQLRQGLAELPVGIEYLWYPSAVGIGATLDRYLLLNAVVDEILDVRFIDHASLNMPEVVGGPMTLEAVAKLEAAASEPTIPLIYVGPGKWAFDELSVALDYVVWKWGDEASGIVYPGIAHWQAAADSVVAHPCETP